MTFEEWYAKNNWFGGQTEHAGRAAWDAAQEDTKKLKAKIKKLKKDATNLDIHEMDYWRIVERLAELDI
jgi:hypothetical protein